MPSSPEFDSSVIELFTQGLYEVPNLAHKGYPMLDTSKRELTPSEKLIINLNKPDPPPDESLRGFLEQSELARQQTLFDIQDLPLD